MSRLILFLSVILDLRSVSASDIGSVQENLHHPLDLKFIVGDIFFQNKRMDDPYNNYRVSFPASERFYIDLIVNPCGFNGTLDEKVIHHPLGYNCCINHFGRGEYGYMKYDPSFFNGTIAMNFATASNKRIPAGPEEVMQNMFLVDELGALIDYSESRRADDFQIIDDKCEDQRKPFPSCVQSRIRAIISPFVPPCWDHNQTVNSLRSCFSTDGSLSPHCMQVGYAQNSYIHICDGEFSLDERCGTFIEIHIPNGSPYDSEETVLSATKITTKETNGMLTTTISLTYMNNPNHILCAYEEKKIRIGSMVKILGMSPKCCCPPKFSAVTNTGSFFCPKKRNSRPGPFTDHTHTITEKLQRDEDLNVYPYCGAMDMDKDILMCSRETAGWLPSHVKMDRRTGKQYMGSGFFFSLPCDAIKDNYTRTNGLLIDSTSQFGSDQLEGIYQNRCPLGLAFQSCAMTTHGCLGGDSFYTFSGETGKVYSIVQSVDPKMNLYNVSFNDGRTMYEFPQYMLELQNPISNYELWFVQRNRLEKILQKRKGFRVQWPNCTFDLQSDQYLPYAILQEGKPLSVVNYTSRIRN